MSLQTPEVHPPKNTDEVDDNLVTAVKTEVEHEVHTIQHTKEPVDPTQSDKLVQKHFSGLFIALLVFVAVVLLIAIGGIVLFTHH
jgi:preprotein translocase subunit SecF